MALDPGALRRRTARARRRGSSAAALMRLVVLTQVVDADIAALAQTNDVVAALARALRPGGRALRTASAATTCPPNVRLRTFGSRSRLGRGVRLRAGAGGRAGAEPARRGARAHDPALPDPRRPAREGAPDPARALVHALAREPLAAARAATRRPRAQRRRRIVPARDSEAPRDRARHRRRTVPAARARRARRAAAPARVRPHRALEGIRDAARRALARRRRRARRRARAARAVADAGRGRAPRRAGGARRRRCRARRRVRIEPPVARDAIPELLAAADLVVSPTRPGGT